MASTWTKLVAKRLLVGSVGLAVRGADQVRDFAQGLVGLAERHGLERHRGAERSRFLPTAFGLSDFLFLMRRMDGAAAPVEKTDPPICSIIVLAYNKAEFTFQCLRSLFREIEDLSGVEIIVVNNASSDETSEMLSFFRNDIRVVDNSENLGFVGGCNSEASVATGKHLIFVNNDTVVLTGWLDHLIGTVETDAMVGAVGSMFLYPDGRIQEAGSIVWRDAHAHHYGWGSSVSDRRFTFAREWITARVPRCSSDEICLKSLVDLMNATLPAITRTRIFVSGSGHSVTR